MEQTLKKCSTKKGINWYAWTKLHFNIHLSFTQLRTVRCVHQCIADRHLAACDLSETPNISDGAACLPQYTYPPDSTGYLFCIYRGRTAWDWVFVFCLKYLFCLPQYLATLNIYWCSSCCSYAVRVEVWNKFTFFFKYIYKLFIAAKIETLLFQHCSYCYFETFLEIGLL